MIKQNLDFLLCKVGAAPSRAVSHLKVSRDLPLKILRLEPSPHIRFFLAPAWKQERFRGTLLHPTR